MDPVTAVLTYLVLWWLSLFVVLPLGVRSQVEDGDVVDGSEPGAPSQPRLKRKLIQTSVLALILFVLVWLAIVFNLARFLPGGAFDG
jgi:predicted secreted protein